METKEKMQVLSQGS